MSGIFIGTVILSVPQQGLALVSATGGTYRYSDLIPATLPYSDGQSGVVEQPHIHEGATVLCAKMPDSDRDAYIISVLNNAVCTTTETTEGLSLYKTGSYEAEDDRQVQQILEQIYKSAPTLKNRAHSVNPDAIPGDYDITDKYGTSSIHIGRQLLQLRGSPLAFIDISGVTNTIRQIAACVERHTPLSFNTDTAEYAISDIAISEAEAFGIPQGPVLVEDSANKTVKLADDDAIPLYRMQSVSGALADGQESLIVNFPIKKDSSDYADKHTADTPPEILAKSRTSLTGEKTDASALGITSFKTPFIRGIQQLGYGVAKKFDDILEPFDRQDDKDSAAPDATDDVRISDAAINKILDTMLTDDYLEKLQKKMAEKGLIISSADSTLMRNRFDAVPVGGPSEQQEYPQPDSVKLTDPVTGKESTYFKTTSFISQEPDGSILITDGYGSEIRMSRGNIYISPALDLLMRPGRDLSTMVPRHQSFNSQATFTLSTSGSGYIKASKDQKVASGVSGYGILTLENRALSNTKESGILMKSRTNTAVTGNDIYIGRNSGTSTVRGSVSEPPGAGTIVIDACGNGTIMERSIEHSIDSNSITLLANDTTALAVSSGRIGLFARDVVIPASVRLPSLREPPVVHVIRNGVRQQLQLSVFEKPQLFVQSNAVIGGSLLCNNPAKFNSGIATNGLSQEDSIGRFKKTDTSAVQLTAEYGKASAELMRQASQTVYQDAFIADNEFRFPETYDVSPVCRMPGMVWQTYTEDVLKNPSAGRKEDFLWIEESVISVDGTETECYPGYSVWESADISGKGYKTEKLKNGYITNSRRSK